MKYPFTLHHLVVSDSTYLRGGGLLGAFKFAHLHFHWGDDETTGSEHTIKGAAYPLEMHLVHFNRMVGSNKAAPISLEQSCYAMTFISFQYGSDLKTAL